MLQLKASNISYYRIVRDELRNTFTAIESLVRLFVVIDTK